MKKKSKAQILCQVPITPPTSPFYFNNLKPLHFLYQRPNAFRLCISLIKWEKSWKEGGEEKELKPSTAGGCFPHLLLTGPNSLCTVSCMTVPVFSN